jgi:hypothetical protein
MCCYVYEFWYIFVRVYLTAAERRKEELVTLPRGQFICLYHKQMRSGGGGDKTTQTLLSTTPFALAHDIVGKMCCDHGQMHEN